jgi:hypothetical protein
MRQTIVRGKYLGIVVLRGKRGVRLGIRHLCYYHRRSPLESVKLGTLVEPISDYMEALLAGYWLTKIGVGKKCYLKPLEDSTL